MSYLYSTVLCMHRLSSTCWLGGLGQVPWPLSIPVYFLFKWGCNNYLTKLLWEWKKWANTYPAPNPVYDRKCLIKRTNWLCYYKCYYYFWVTISGSLVQNTSIALEMSNLSQERSGLCGTSFKCWNCCLSQVCGEESLCQCTSKFLSSLARTSCFWSNRESGDSPIDVTAFLLYSCDLIFHCFTDSRIFHRFILEPQRSFKFNFLNRFLKH